MSRKKTHPIICKKKPTIILEMNYSTSKIISASPPPPNHVKQWRFKAAAATPVY